MKKLLAVILSIIISAGCMPCVIAQAAPIFQDNRSYSVLLNGEEIELSQYKEPANLHHKVVVPTDTESIVIKQGDAGFPALVSNHHYCFITDNEEIKQEYLDDEYDPWEGCSYDASGKYYVINIADLENEEELILMDSNRYTSHLYICKADVVVSAPEDDVINAIAALPTPVALENKEAVEAARAAYDALDDAVKANVTNYQTLVIAELTIEKLQLEADKTALKSDLDEAKKDLEQSKANEKELQDELYQVKEDLGTANGEKEDLQEQLNEKKEELATAQQETTALTEQVDTLKKDIKEKDDELKSVKEELATAKVTPEKVVITSVVNKKTKKAIVKWAKAPKATGYEVYRKVGKSGSYKKVKTISKASTVSFTNSKLKKGKTYYYKVRAVNKTNGKTTYGAFSAVKKVKIKK